MRLSATTVGREKRCGGEEVVGAKESGQLAPVMEVATAGGGGGAVLRSSFAAGEMRCGGAGGRAARQARRARCGGGGVWPVAAGHGGWGRWAAAMAVVIWR